MVKYKLMVFIITAAIVKENRLQRLEAEKAST